MNGTDISVIIPFYGSKHDLERCLDGLLKQNFSGSFDITVVESGIDPYINEMVSRISNARLISSENIMTPGQARNLGVKYSGSPLLAFLDADCIPDTEWLTEIYSALQKYQIVIGPVLNQYPFHPFASVDNLLQFVDFQKYRDSEITHFPACNLGIKNDLFQITSGFPEDLITGEDVMFSEEAIKRSRGNIFYNKKQVIRHSGRTKYSQFLKHNEILGYYRGYFNLKIKNPHDPQSHLLFYSLYYVFRRLIYITFRTLQWNPIGIFRIIFYSPMFMAGLFSWGIGFYKGNKKYSLNQTLFIPDWHKGYK